MTGVYIGTSPLKSAYVGTTPVKEIYVGTTKVRPTTLPGLCFTAEDAGATVALTKTGSPTSVTIETSTDGGSTWSTYTIGNTITLSNVGDKVLFRNASSTTTNFSTSGNSYRFTTTGGNVGCSGDVTYLINKNGGVDTIPNTYCFSYLFYGATNLTTPPELPSTTLKSYCYRRMFVDCSALKEAPGLPATVLSDYCYYVMFYNCTGLVTPPELPATTLAEGCYSGMFRGCENLAALPKLYALNYPNLSCGTMFQYCDKIKISTTKTGDYQTEYRIPMTGTGSGSTSGTSGATYRMFYSSGGTYTGSPSLNTTYYTSNTVV